MTRSEIAQTVGQPRPWRQACVTSPYGIGPFTSDEYPTAWVLCDGEWVILKGRVESCAGLIWYDTRDKRFYELLSYAVEQRRPLDRPWRDLRKMFGKSKPPTEKLKGHVS
jgi:hypothetical protein